jgi:actin
MCLVVNDFDAAIKESSESTAFEKLYELPDGRKITLGAERFRCPEALFEPSVAHYEMVGV